MSELNKGVGTALAVLVAAGAIVAGATVRGKNDLGGTGDGTLVAGTLRQYVASKADRVDVPAADYYYELTNKLKAEYVEPVGDDMKLLAGAVRGMVSSLADTRSSFMAKDEFVAFLKSRQGVYSGIGADIELEVTRKATEKPSGSPPETESNETSAEEALALGFQIPRVVIADVVPGGPADKAGLKPGDVVYAVDDHWVANADEFNRFRQVQKDFLDKKLDKAKYIEARNEMREKTERALMPGKVREKLVLGVAGMTRLEVMRGGKKLALSVEKGPSQRPGFEANGDTVRLSLTEGVAERLSEAIKGKSRITIDLRHSGPGDYDVMRSVLAVLAPAGRYGTLAKEREGTSEAFAIEKGNESPPEITLLVDRTTRGPAEILALALSSRNRAKLSGEAMGGDRSVREITELPDGSGYTLVTSEYSTRIDDTVIVRGEAR